MKIPKHLIHTFVLFLLLAVPRSATARHTFSFNVLPGVVTSSYYPVPGRSYVNRMGLGFSMGYRYMSSGGFGGEASFSHCQTFYPYNGHLNCNFYDISLVYGHDFSKKWMAVIGGGVGVAVCLNQGVAIELDMAMNDILDKVKLFSIDNLAEEDMARIVIAWKDPKWDDIVSEH